LKRGRMLAFMPTNDDEINSRLGISLQIEMLQRNLEENARSWIASGLGMIHNTVTDSIRRDIAEKQLLLKAAEY
jgi:hypothetical protein